MLIYRQRKTSDGAESAMRSNSSALTSRSSRACNIASLPSSVKLSLPYSLKMTSVCSPQRKILRKVSFKPPTLSQNFLIQYPPAVHLVLQPRDRWPIEVPGETRMGRSPPHDLVGKKRMQIMHGVG